MILEAEEEPSPNKVRITLPDANPASLSTLIRYLNMFCSRVKWNEKKKNAYPHFFQAEKLSENLNAQSWKLSPNFLS